MVLIILAFYLITKKGSINSKYLILTVLCLIYNISNGLIPDSNFITDIRSQYYITFAIGILVSCYSFYFIHYEHNIKIFSKNIVKGIITGFCGWYIISFVSLYSITNNLSLCRIIFFLYPIGISFFWFYKFRTWLIDSAYKSWSDLIKIKIYAGLIAMISLFSFPIILIIFEDNQPLERSIYNIGFISLSYYFFYRLWFYTPKDDDKIDEQFLKDLNINLTKRQNQVLREIFENPEKSYTDLSEKLNISISTFTTHSTNIYKALSLEDKSKKGLIKFLKDKKSQI
ncbi:winged helix-turn-helix transcriptional regulator [Tenacibaculum aiptasiae]|uniref:winged helix-turn-helix transcriptional regulator n=1 Tax=Tenacibaculum aiptasiae TaxID=426481 RepID=UPI00232C2E43|nr:winged helix-turn-helix transcriptional regulator [Tenacibaculum aiptasiae]